ncbi:hypothetical protein FRACYDRAFT_236418 [Fragilariopsis cylindrus CCMP1102]|jgi:hypothetical protein|uniref:Uncharacterized protein n=1 Tax=Fragilariopsis cylindrus CCMP1102 TaxID=635003 RepID=A0A1E7FQF6_9STRA|nr:hypothetical protein FRACYDRAFT_236418 [Fragilariopsis cylindrus CCMP1102]|eukprot:OEU20344.1 hypothetical protein FRACYDRAFT_236418 [Fragilariopsis cylindrus CCMP1102]
MNTSYYSLDQSTINDLKSGGLTMVTMQQGEMGIMMFTSPNESFRYNDNCITLKREIAALNKEFEDGNVGKKVYYKNVAKWCSNVLHFANEWSPHRVPFDIRDGYDDCMNTIGCTSTMTWPDKVQIPMSELPDEARNEIVASYTVI